MGILENTEARDIDILDPGLIHNEALRVFHSNFNLSANEKMDMSEFIDLALASFNSTLEKHEVPLSATKKDMKIILSIFAQIKDDGVYDFYSFGGNISLENTIQYFEMWAC